MAQQTDKSKRHTEGLLIKKFCTQRKSKCDPCGNKYDDCVKNATDLAVAFKFPRLKKEAAGTVVQKISQNAHHILCVAEVTKVISKDEGLEAILKNTEYCVNADLNMVPLPLFAHTIYWYSFSDLAGDRQKLGKVMSALKAPPFQNLPNHDFDHGKYNKEVETCLNKLKGYVKKADHKFETGQIADALNNISNGFRAKLKKRGARKGGTHKSWESACKGDIDEWYMAFSLAKKPVSQAFPARVTKNVNRLKGAIALLTGGS